MFFQQPLCTPALLPLFLTSLAIPCPELTKSSSPRNTPSSPAPGHSTTLPPTPISPPKTKTKLQPQALPPQAPSPSTAIQRTTITTTPTTSQHPWPAGSPSPNKKLPTTQSTASKTAHIQDKILISMEARGWSEAMAGMRGAPKTIGAWRGMSSLRGGHE
ncbi:hypothetical protein BKA64DRAFT_652651 [Cadophora sp. MPI-SDFR-AT-0126]|nr:hypothetical protein BKA64DRAFT_652651 [Leotiomycetes sp. MPI-SDFR-AT-0126]